MTESSIRKITPYIGERIRDGIELAKTNQRQLAKDIDISEPSLSNIINGNQNPGLETIEKIAEALDLPPAFFLPPYSLKNGDSPRMTLLASIIEDIMALQIDYLKSLKVITDALRVRMGVKSK